MTDFPAKADLTDASVTEGGFKTALEQLLDALDERLVAGATPITNFVSTGIDDATTALTMRLTNNTIAYGQAGTAFTLHHRADNTSFVRIFGGDAVDNGGAILFYGGAHPSQADQVRVYNGTNERLRFEQAGTVRPGGDGTQDFGSASFQWNDIFLVNAPTVSSSGRIKDDIEDNPLGLAFIERLRPRRYRLKSGRSGRFHGGFVAEEVEQAIIASGLTTEDVGAFVRAPHVDADGRQIFDAEGEPAMRLGLRYDELHSAVVKAVQELAALTRAIDGRVAALETA